MYATRASRGTRRSRATPSRVLALAALFLGPALSSSLVSPAAAQSPTGAFVTSVRFANLSGYRRIEWGLATVPFPMAVWTAGKVFGTPGFTSDLTPFGAQWPDGSVRYAQLAVLLDLDPEEEIVVDVTEGATPPPPFVKSPWVARGESSFDLSLNIAVTGQGQRVVHLQPISKLDDTASRQTVLSRSTVPGTDLVAEMWLSKFSDADHMPFELRITSSKVGSTKWTQSVDSIDLQVTGAFANIRASKRRGVTVFAQTPTGPNRVALLGADTFFDGQGQEWSGELYFSYPSVSTPSRPAAVRTSTIAAAIASQLWGVSTDWASSGALGPYGAIPPPPPWVTDGGRMATQFHRAAFLSYLQGAGTPWDDWPLGLLPDPGSTGDQQDFGAIKLLEIYASARPYGIEEGRINAGEEALRPVHHREPDGSPVLSRNHPQWVTWAGRTHFSNAVSPDRLGKPYPEPQISAHGWLGRDDEHWSSLVLASAYLLTRSWSLRYEIDNEAELYVAGHTLPSMSPGLPTNGMGPARGVGRTMLSLSWNFLLTGNTELRDRLVARMLEVVWPTATATQVTGPVRPTAVLAPDPRLLNRTHWRPWEETQAVLGLEALYRVTGTIEAHLAAAVSAWTTMNAGWLIQSPKSIIGSAIGWKANGAALTPQEYQDPSWVQWSFGTNYDEWSVSADLLTMRYAALYNNPPMNARATFVYDQLLASRVQPAGNPGWDRFSEWQAVN